MNETSDTTRLTPEEYFDAADYAWLERVANYDHDDPDRLMFANDGEAARTCAGYAIEVLDPDCHEYFLNMLQRRPDQVTRFAANPDYGRCLVLCLRYCADVWENPHALRWLGFLHQIGRFVEHDAQEAARLYRLAELQGDLQSAVNLGYLYAYGHLGEPDLEASFKQFVKVMALGNFPEAINKVGDAYARAQVVERDLRTAYQLYRQCYDSCGDLIGVKAQAAFRLAELVIDEDNRAWDIPYDPVMALHYYQVAEVGMRIQIADDSPWYAERLEQAIAGQDRARALMDAMGVDLARRHRMTLA